MIIYRPSLIFGLMLIASCLAGLLSGCSRLPEQIPATVSPTAAAITQIPTKPEVTLRQTVTPSPIVTSPSSIPIQATLPAGSINRITLENAHLVSETLRLGRGSPDEIAWIPDGKTLFISTSIELRLLDGLTYKELRAIPLDTAASALAISPDGKTIAVGIYSAASNNSKIQLFDLATGNLLKTFSGHKGEVTSLAFSPVQDSLLATSLYTTLAWDLSSGTQLTLPSDARFIELVSFSADGKTLVTAGENVQIRDPVDYKLLQTLETGGTVHSLAWSPDGNVLALGLGGGEIQLWDWQKGTRQNTITGFEDLIFSLAFSPDGKTLAAGAADGTLTLWDPVTASRRKTLSEDFSGHSLAYSPDGKILAAVCVDGLVRLWDTGSYSEPRLIEDFSSYMNGVDISPDGRWLVSGSRDNWIRIWRYPDGILARKLNNGGIVEGVAFSPDSQHMAAVSGSHLATFLVSQGDPVWEKTAEEALNKVVYSPTGAFIATLSEEMIFRLWNAASGDSVKELRNVQAFAFSPDGNSLAFGDQAGAIQMLDLKTGQFRDPIPVSSEFYQFTALDFSPDGTRLAAGDGDGAVSVFNFSDGALLYQLVSSSDAINAVQFSPDGTLLAAAGWDGLVWLYSVQDGKLMAELPGHTSWVDDLDWAPDGASLASIGWDQTIRLWGFSEDIAQQLTPLPPLPTHTPLVPGEIAVFPQATPQIKVEPYAARFPKPFPLAMPLSEQVDEARTCEAARLAEERYPKSLSGLDLRNHYRLKTNCDWAALVVAHAMNQAQSGELPDSDKDEFAALLEQNLAYAFNPQVIGGFFSAINLVEAPPVASQPIEKVSIDYSWGGLGDPVDYQIEIANAAKEPKITVNGLPSDLAKAIPKTIDAKTIQALGPALVDLLPVKHHLTLLPCFDNMPDWKVKLTFADGEQLDLVTQDSNFLQIGGPWQTTIDGVKYMQYSAAFPRALYAVIKALKLPLGRPQGMYCDLENMKNPIDQAYR